MNVKRQGLNMINLPSSLWQFYRNCTGSRIKVFLFLTVLFVVLYQSGGVLVPFVDYEVVKLFKQPLPQDTTLLHYVGWTLFWVFAVQMGSTIARWLSVVVQAHSEPQTKNKISEILTSYIHKQSISFWTSKMSGSMNSEINYIADGFSMYYEIVATICRLMVILGNCICITIINPRLAIFFVSAICLHCWLTWFLGKKMVKPSAQVAKAQTVLSGKLTDSFSNAIAVKYFAGIKHEEQMLSEARSKVMFWGKIKYRAERRFSTLPSFLFGFIQVSTYGLCFLLYAYGYAKIEDMSFMLTAYFFVMNAILKVANAVPKIIDTLSKAKRAYKDLIAPITIVDKPNAPDLVVKKGAVEFKHVVFGYRNRTVLTDLSLHIKPGERVGIVGASGSGKSTLVHLLMRFYEPQNGQILIDGQNISDITQDSLHENIAFIPQDPAMFNRTIGENIGYGKLRANKAEIKKAAKNASADEFIMETEKKYNSLVGDRGIKLSGGQRQRIAIARAFLKDAPILILDEATSALDSETETAIQEAFEKLSKGRTTLAIAHRLSTLRNMDKIIVLDKGKIVEQGTHQQLLRKKGKYYQLWQMQSDGFLKTKTLDLSKI